MPCGLTRLVAGLKPVLGTIAVVSTAGAAQSATLDPRRCDLDATEFAGRGTCHTVSVPLDRQGNAGSQETILVSVVKAELPGGKHPVLYLQRSVASDFAVSMQQACAGEIARASLDGKTIDEAAQCIGRLLRTQWIVERGAGR